MFARIISSLLIPTFMACPVICSYGVCRTSCCSAKQSLTESCRVNGTTPHCCQQSRPANDEPCSQPSPASPAKAPCHGICGGAVFEKPVEVDEVANQFFVPLTDTDVAFVVLLTECQSRSAEQHWYCHGGNQGRSLRALHMSLLC